MFFSGERELRPCCWAAGQAAYRSAGSTVNPSASITCARDHRDNRRRCFERGLWLGDCPASERSAIVRAIQEVSGAPTEHSQTESARALGVPTPPNTHNSRRCQVGSWGGKGGANISDLIMLSVIGTHAHAHSQ